MARWVDPPMILWNERAASSGAYTYDFDFSAYEQVTFWYTVTGQTGDASAATLDAVWSRKEPTHEIFNDSELVWNAIAGSSITQITTNSGGTGIPASTFTILTSSALNGRVRLTLTVGMSSGTTPTLTTTVTGLLKG